MKPCGGLLNLSDYYLSEKLRKVISRGSIITTQATLPPFQVWLLRCNSYQHSLGNCRIRQDFLQNAASDAREMGTIGAVKCWRQNMNLTLKISSIILAVLYALSFGSYQWFTRHSTGSEFLFFDSCTLTGYLVLAIFWRNSQPSISRIGAIAIFLAGVLPVLTGLVQTFFFPTSVTDSPAAVQDSRWLEVAFASAICLILGWATWMARRPAPLRRVRSTGFLLVLGSFFVLSSMFLSITVAPNYPRVGNGEGWRVLDRQEQWITAYASVGQSVFMGEPIKWLQPIFPTAGYPLYALTIVTSMAVLIIAFSLRFSARQLAASKIFTRLTAFLTLATLWIVTDAHWGWHFDFADHRVSAVIATLTWFAMMMVALFATWHIARGNISFKLISWFRLIQLPMIAFNLMLLRAYFERDSEVPLHGLGMLLIGLPILSWSCQQILLTNPVKQKAGMKLSSPKHEELPPHLISTGR